MALASVTITGMGHDAVPLPRVLPQPLIMQSPNKSAPAVNTAAVVNCSAGVDAVAVIGSILFSYDSTPTGGNITVEDGSGLVVINLDIPAAGLYELTFNPTIRSASLATTVIVTLAAGGAACTGKLYVHAWQEKI